MSAEKQKKTVEAEPVQPELKRILVLDETFHFLSLMAGVATMVSLMTAIIKDGSLVVPGMFAVLCAVATVTWRVIHRKKLETQQKLGYRSKRK